MPKLFRTSTIIPAVVIVALLVGGYMVWQNIETKPSNQNTSNNNSDGINYNPATDEQKNAAGGATKDTPRHDESNNKTSLNQDKKSVDVIITTWIQEDGKMKVNGYAEGIVETDGTCTLKLEKDGEIVTSSRPAHVNAQNTTCGESDIAVSELSPGTWQATLSYSSNDYAGTSEPVAVEVTDE